MPTFSPELFDTICERIANGESLRKISKDDDMPSVVSVMRWLAADEELGNQYARAREIQADGEVDEILDIADDDELDSNDKRVRIDARKWRAGKMRPKVYGDKLDVDHKGKVSITIDREDAGL